MKGIYQIRNITNNKVYLGSSVDLEKRWKSHRNDLDRNEHHSSKLQEDWNKYGENCFLFEIIEEVNKENTEINRHELRVIEQQYIDKYKPHQNGYNMSPYAGSLKRYELKKNKHLNKFRAKGNIRKIGNSLGVLIPARFINYMNVTNGSTIYMNYIDDRIIIGTKKIDMPIIDEHEKNKKEREMKELEETIFNNAINHFKEYLESNFKPKI